MMLEVQAVTAVTGGECFLIANETQAVLYDSGYGFCAAETIANIRRALRGRPLRYILLTHSHYDHVCASPAIRAAFPGVQVVASAYAQQVFQKAGARRLMRELHKKSAERHGVTQFQDDVDALTVDRVLQDGQLLPLAGMPLQAIAAPGHTQCCMQYYFPEDGLLAACESLGIISHYPVVDPGVLVSYRACLAALDRAEQLQPKRILAPHYGLLPEGATGLFLRNARKAIEESVLFIKTHAERHCTVEAIVEEYQRAYYSTAQAAIQPLPAFLANTRAMVPRVLQELGMSE